MIYRIFFLLCLNGIGSGTLFALSRISLQQAQHHVGIELKLSGNSFSARKGAMFRLKNNLKQGIELLVNAGQLLRTSHTDAQDLVVTRTELFVIKPGQVLKAELWSMCIEATNRCPSSSDPYQSTGMATGPLLAMAETINKEQLWGSAAAQDAIWCITNQHPLRSIYHENPEVVRMLQMKVAEARGENLLEALKKEVLVNSRVAPQFHTIYRFALKEDSKVELRFYDPQGNQVALLMPEQCLAPGVHEIPVSYYRSFPEEGYYQMVLMQNQVPVKRSLIRLR